MTLTLQLVGMPQWRILLNMIQTLPMAVTKGGVRNNSPLPVEEYRTDPKISDVTDLGHTGHTISSRDN